MRDYQESRALVTGSGWLPRRPQDKHNTTRSDAMNHFAGVSIISFCVYVLAWSILKVFRPEIPFSTVLLCVPVALILGASWGALKLIQFTTVHRDWLYYWEAETGQDLDGDGVIGEPVMLTGTPPDGCMIRGLDGAMHRINTSLSQADIHAVKASMLAGGTYGVRAINSILGDETRASGLRLELHRLGILEKPEARQATKLTAAGKKAVMRWA